MIVVDVETTGVNPYRNGIISLGAIEFTNPDNMFTMECQVSKSMQIDEGALAINGYSLDELYDESKPTTEMLLLKFNQWLRQCKGVKMLVGHNPRFDRDFIEQECARNRIRWSPFPFRTIDIHTVVYLDFYSRNGFEPIRPLGMDVVTEYLNMPKEPKPHVALNGAKWELEILYRVLFMKTSGLPEFEGYELKYIDDAVMNIGGVQSGTGNTSNNPQ